MSSRKTENEKKGKIGELVEEWEVGFVGVNVSEMVRTLTPGDQAHSSTDAY